MCFSSLLGRKPTSESDEEVWVLENGVKIYKYKDLKSATNGFHPDNKIGRGGFGSVYQGKLKNGKLAAIKVLSAESRQGVNEFLAEIKTLACIHHQNLVNLYGCCYEGNHRILVYNYLENNSLEKTLLGSKKGSNGIKFTWKQRASICVGIAQGLAFLHEEIRPHIIHRDIKASNILLDRDLTPKISDFGLAKLFPDNVTHISTRVAGTIGYLAPEYAIRGRLTRKADIYSFGVLLAEIVTGRHNSNSRLPIGEQFLLELVWDCYGRNELALLVDDALDGRFDSDHACKLLKIALLCTQENAKLRPSMSIVAKMLGGEIGIDKWEIKKPGLISDLTELKVRDAPKEAKTERKQRIKPVTASSSLDDMEESGLCSPGAWTGHDTMFSSYYKGRN